MPGETNLSIILKSLAPVLNHGEYTFCTVKQDHLIDIKNIVCFFRESEAVSIIIKKDLADRLNLPYSTMLSWITLTVHSSLEAVGLTAAFSKALSEAGISCNVVAASYHDHIFVPKNDAERAMKILKGLSA